MAVVLCRSSAFFLHLLLPVLLAFGHGSVTASLISHRDMLQMRSLRAASTCTPPPKELVGSVPLVHRQGPCSPLHKERMQTRDSSLIFLRDQSRVKSIRDSHASASSFSNVVHPMDNNGFDLRMPIVFPQEGAGEYVVTVGLGTPRHDIALIFDTGSFLTWTRCLPCTGKDCCPQEDGCFEPSKSSTYSNPPCSLPTCNYSVVYADKSFSNGYFVRDTLTLSPSYQFPNFIFGCAQNNSDGFGSSAGILGLAQGDVSLISQTANTFAQIFCYCIPPAYGSQGYLLLGMGALVNCQTKQYTSILPDRAGSSLYFVKLLGITIGSKRLDFSKLAPSSQPTRTIIDSGTTISRLPPSVYAAVRDEFTKEMSKYPVAQPLPPLLDSCYNLKGQGTVALPKMVLNFDGTNVNIDPTGVVWRESDSQVCLAFTANGKDDDLTIIGSTQQRKLNILYDIQEKKVEFGTGSC